ncbi:hypothetical protein N7532_009637 [Penicillium argentinense]|uniref:Uncharacterized protein n=1 Tax=Penicillium argentinense TaxID=1131581 RepID=A0A9W9EZQ6_9EURO|nr:uncharacterized protein N7532_009637 [Penicillium argentinense]KAJ5090953.1 hypothetical protein N7532_009637 [Penicillium argentinense]
MISSKGPLLVLFSLLRAISAQDAAGSVTTLTTVIDVPAGSSVAASVYFVPISSLEATPSVSLSNQPSESPTSTPVPAESDPPSPTSPAYTPPTATNSRNTSPSTSSGTAASPTNRVYIGASGDRGDSKWWLWLTPPDDPDDSNNLNQICNDPAMWWGPSVDETKDSDVVPLPPTLNMDDGTWSMNNPIQNVMASCKYTAAGDNSPYPGTFMCPHWTRKVFCTTKFDGQAEECGNTARPAVKCEWGSSGTALSWPSGWPQY